MTEFKFFIEKKMGCSAGNVVANYLDIEHVGFHSNLKSIRVISEGVNSALFVLETAPFGIRLKTISYFEFRTPNVIFQFNKSIFYEMEVTSEIIEITKTSEISSKVNVSVVMRVPFFLSPFKKIIIFLAKRENKTILNEDLLILRRRHKLFGAYVDDYLKPEQRIIFKSEFERCYRGDHLKYQQSKN